MLMNKKPNITDEKLLILKEIFYRPRKLCLNDNKDASLISPPYKTDKQRLGKKFSFERVIFQNILYLNEDYLRVK